MEILFQRITRQFLNRKAFLQMLKVILCPLPNQSKVKYIQKQCLDPVTSIYDYSLLNYEAQNYTAGIADIKNGLYIYILVFSLAINAIVKLFIRIGF